MYLNSNIYKKKHVCINKHACLTYRSTKTNVIILAWENEKKSRAKLRMEKKNVCFPRQFHHSMLNFVNAIKYGDLTGSYQHVLENRRERNFLHYQGKMERIDHTAREWKKQVEKKRRNEASEVKRKAREIRSTGKIPFSCFCFKYK